ncbi:MAG: PEGA domain-containing protein [Acidobacteria bacterium]|nr:PEGA domain-containing protein [Acidobacteriota bacterium]
MDAAGNSFDRIRYNGGTVQTTVDYDDWDNRLIVDSREIRLDLKDGQIIRIDPRRVTGIGYGQEAHRRVGTMVAVGILVAPLALFGLLHKTRLHYVSIEFTTEQGTRSALLIQAHKDNYRAVLTALRGVTDVPIAVAEDDREFVPSSMPMTVAASQKAGSAMVESGSLRVSSIPELCEVNVDGSYVGNTPAQLKLQAGKHVISVFKDGFVDWTREIVVLAGSDLNVVAALTPPTVDGPTLPPPPPNTARLQIVCSRCGAAWCIQLNLGEPIATTPGCFSFPSTNTFTCPKCQNVIDISETRSGPEKQEEASVDSSPDSSTEGKSAIPAVDPTLPPPPANTVRVGVKCIRCANRCLVQANLGKAVALATGAHAFPSDNRLECPKCSAIIDLTQLRTQIEKQTKKKVM